MVVRRVRWVVAAAVSLGACGDDVAAGSGDDGGTAGETADVADDGDGADDDHADDTHGDDGDDGDGGGTCTQDADCVSEDPCLAGICDGGACTFEPALTGECRPAIDVEYPPRGATIEGEAGDVVTIVGRVTTGVGTIESLTLDGEDVDVASDGSFVVDVEPNVGGNVLVLETVDSNGWTRRRVQSFLWSTTWLLPTEPMEGAAPQGLLMYLDQEAIDDGDRTLPVDDLGSIFHVTLDSFDLSGFIDPTSPVASQAGYDIFVTSLTKQSVQVALTAIDGGLHLDAAMLGIDGDLVFDCTNLLCELAGGDGTGGLSIDAIEIGADILLSAGPGHDMQVELANVATDVTGLDIWSNNGWTDFLLSLLEPLLLDALVGDVEALLADELASTLGPLLVEGLAGFSISAPLEFPSLSDPRGSITVQLETDVGDTDFHDGVAPPSRSPPQGGLIEFRGGGYVQEHATPYETLGIPYRAGCGDGDPHISVARQSPLEVGLADDLLNQLLYGAWAGGLLEFELASDDPGGMGGEGGGGISVMGVTLSGMLAPTATDCNPDGALLAHVGDLRIEATIEINGKTLDFVAYSSLALPVEIGAGREGITIAIPGIEWIETELTVMQDDAIGDEASLRELLEAMLEQQLVAGLSGGFGGIALPEIDLSGIANLPPGSVLMSIHIESVERRPGISVLHGHF